MFGFLRVPFDTDNFWGVKEVINGQHFPAFNSSNKPGRHKQEETKEAERISHWTVIQYLVFNSRFNSTEAKNRQFGNERNSWDVV